MEGDRKSMEPMAARLAPNAVEAKRQALQHFVTHSPWRDDVVRSALARRMDKTMPEEAAWLIDDTGFPKQGKHSVGVKRQYSGTLGKVGNCQVAVSVHLASDEASVPLDFELYLPRDWTEDGARRREAKIPDGVAFRPKWQIALERLDRLLAWGLRRRDVAADAGYGGSTAFRDGLWERGLNYTVGVESKNVFWVSGEEPKPPVRRPGARGRPRTRWRAGDAKPQSAERIATTRLRRAFRKVTWREGSKGRMQSRFARLRVRAAPRRPYCEPPRPEEWLLVEWPAGEARPTKYWLSTAPSTLSLKKLVRCAKLRWRIERDYEDLKGEVGLDHFEGRTLPGWHHHVTLTMVAYAFLMTRRLGDQKNLAAELDAAACPARTSTAPGPMARSLLALPTTNVVPNPCNFTIGKPSEVTG
jgi:SRSO17 transposase